MIYIASREAVNRPIAVPDSAPVTCSPTGSICMIASMHSSLSYSSNGSHSTVFIPPLSSLPDIDNFNSIFSGPSRQSSIVSSYHTRTIDNTVIQNQEYIYPGDPRCVISFAESSPSTLLQVREIHGKFAGTARTYSSGDQMDASRSESDRENEEHEGDEGRTPSGTF